MKKKIIGLVLALTMLTVMIPALPATADYDDVDTYEPYYDAVNVLSALDIISGFGDGTYRPDELVTRAQFTKLVVEALNEREQAEDNKSVSKFYDVTPDHWARGYINQGVKDGFIAGYNDNEFGPDDNVTYIQAIKMLVCATGYELYSEGAGGYPNGYKTWGYELGICNVIEDYADNDMQLTRGDAAIMIYNAMNAPLCVIESYETMWNGRSVPNYKEMNGTGKDWQTLFTKMHNVYTTQGYMDDRGAFTITSSQNFDDEYFPEGSNDSFDVYWICNVPDKGKTTTAYIEKDKDGDYCVLYTLGGYDRNSYIISKSNNDEEIVTLDEPDPDIEIYSFETDTFDVLVGTSETITFTSEIFANIELNNTDVAIVDEYGSLLGYMNDDGEDGDEQEDDGIYTLREKFTANEAGNTMYYVKADDVYSDGINICYYREFTDSDLNAADSIISDLDEIAKPYLIDNIYVAEEDLAEILGKMNIYLEQEENKGAISSYHIGNDYVEIISTSGYPFTYGLQIDGLLTGGNDVFIATYQPFYGMLGGNDQIYNESTDGVAKSITKEFDKYKFPSNYNYDSDNVTFDNLKKLSECKVIIWCGHGTYDDSKNGTGSRLYTGELYSKNTTKTYSADITAGRIVVTGTAEKKRYSVTGGFFQKYLDEMNNAFVYLNTCHSGHDMIDNITHKYQLGRSFLAKGATTVIGNSDVIHQRYACRMAKDIIGRMCEKNVDAYYDANEALSYAKKANGDKDTNGTEVIIFPQNNKEANNYTFSLPSTGSISGSVKDANSNSNISNALVRVYKDGYFLRNTRTDSNGYYSVNVPTGDYIVKVNAGHYKTAKAAVNVTAGNTTYTETFLMVGVGISRGFANGQITSAVSGEGVSDVKISMRSGWNNQDGNILDTEWTNDNGYYEYEDVPGFYTMEYSKDGYITGYKNIIVGILDLTTQNASISPELPDDGEYRFVLTWRNRPEDLDAHLSGPTRDGDIFHLYYSDAGSDNGYYNLDLDNTSISSRSDPETITIHKQLRGVYRYSVHDYSNGGYADSDALSRSGATVTIYKGNVEVRTFPVPTNEDGTIWTVFELSGDEITPINKMGNGTSDDRLFYSSSNKD